MEHPDTKSIPLGKIFPSGLVAKTVIALLVCFFFFTKEANATHFRYGNVSWTRNANGSVTFRITQAWRRSFGWNPTPNLNAVINTGTFNYGDGTSANINLLVTAVNISEDWFYGEATLTKTYAGNGPYTAFFASNARLSTLQNGADAGFRVETQVNTTGGNSSPVSSIPPIINIPVGNPSACFQIPVTDPNGDPMTFSLSTPAQQGNSGSLPPNSQPTAIGITVDANTGVVCFNTVGKTVGWLYTASVRVSDGKGGIITIDFIIRLVQPSSPPYYDYSITPANGFVYNIQPGQTLVFTVKAQDNDVGDIVTLQAAGLPPGATMSSPPLPANGNPVQSTFTWTPTTSQLGSRVITFSAQDIAGNQVLTTVIIIVSMNPVFETPPTPGNGDEFCIPSGVPYSTTIKANSPDAGMKVRISAATIPGGATLTPPVPTAFSNPVSTVFNWTPPVSAWGPNVNSFTVTDTLNNSVSTSFTIIVNTAPSFTSAPSGLNISVNQPFTYNITIADPDVPFGDVLNPLFGVALPAWLTLTQTGPGTATLTGTPGPGDVGANHVILLAEDIYHHCQAEVRQEFDINVAPCTFAGGITVSPQGPYCPGAQVTLTAAAGGTYTWSTGAQTQSITVTAGATTQYAVSATVNFCGSKDSISITGADQIKPVANCKNATLDLDANGNATLDASAINNNSTDNCAIASITVSPSSFTCAQLGSNLVTLTVTDASGNSATCTAVVTVRDRIAPSVTCKNATITLDANGQVTLDPALVTGSATDNCGGVTLTVNPSTFTCANIGSNNVLLTATDSRGNSATCSAIVTVTETVPPVALCKPATVYLNASGIATVSASDVNDGSYDNCLLGPITVSPSSFDCEDLGENTVTLTVKDARGNTSTCTTTVTVVDQIPPTAMCLNARLVLDASGAAYLDPGDVDNGSEDNCGLASLELSQNDFDCSNIGQNSVTLTATDASGNTASCTSTVTVVDLTNPVALCKPATIVLDANGVATLTTADVNNNSYDNCGIVSYSLSKTAFGCEDVGENSVTLTVTDASGNSSSCNATVTVLNNILPSVVCKDATLTLDADGNATLTVGDVNNGSGSNCGLASITLSQYTFSCADLGENTVTLTATDATGNASTCTATVTIEDHTAPNAICKDATVILDADGHGTLTTAEVDNGSYDGCGGSVTLSLSDEAFDCEDVGTTSVILTVTDASGNSSTCEATVTVVDLTAPIALCKSVTVTLDANGNGTLSAEAVNDGSYDGCGGNVTLSLSNDAFDCEDVGTTSVILTVTDASGNTATCEATVTVEDVTAPTAICQNAVVILDANGNGTLTTGDIDNGSFDGCSDVTLSLSDDAFDCEDLGTTSVILTVTDASGNTSTCEATVTVLDQTAPIALCKDATVYLDANGEGTITTSDIDNGSFDGCGDVTLALSDDAFDCEDLGTTTVILTVTDESGNTATCEGTVTVIDNIAPNAFCKGATLTLDAQGQATLNTSDIDNGSNDNCGIVSYSLSKTSFDCSNVGNNQVTLTVTDASGNSSSCNANVKVLDTNAPFALCKDISVTLVNGVATITGASIDNGSYDGCGGTVTLGALPNTFLVGNAGPNTVTLTVTDASGNTSTCIATVTVINPEIHCQVTSTGQSVTVGGSVDLLVVSADAVAPVIYNWTPAAGLSCTNCPNPTFTPSAPGTYVFNSSISDANGSTTNCAVAIIALAPPITCSVNAPSTTVSMGNCVDLTVTHNGHGPFTYTWTVTGCANCTTSCPSAGLSSTNSPNPTFCPCKPGTYVVCVEVTDAWGQKTNCCIVIIVPVPPITCSIGATATVTYPNTPVNLTVNSTGTAPFTYSWSPATNLSCSNCATPKFTAATPGTYILDVTVTDSYGATTTCTVVIYVTAPPITCTVGASSTVLQAGNSVTLNVTATGTAPFTYLWTPATGLSCNNCPNPVFTPTTPGTYFFSAKVTDAYGSSSNCAITVIVLPPPITCTVGASATTCVAGDPVNLSVTSTGTAPFTYAWSPGTFLSCTNCPNPVFTPGVPGTYTYTVTVTDAYQATTTCNITIVVLPKPIVCSVSASATSTLPGTPATLSVSSTGTAPFTYLWSPSGSLSCGACANPVFTPTAPGNYTFNVTVTDTYGSKSSCNITILVLPPPVTCNLWATSTSTTAGTSTTLTATASGGKAPYSYNWSPSAGLSCTNCASPVFTPAAPGSYSFNVTVTDAYGTTSTCSITISVTVPPISCNAYTNRSTVYLGYGAQNAILSVSSSGTAPFTYQWNPAGLLTAANTANPVFYPAAEGNYTFTVKVTDAYGATTTCSVDVCVLDIRAQNCPYVYVCHYNSNTGTYQTITVHPDEVNNYLCNGKDRLGRCNQSCGSLKDGGQEEEEVPSLTSDAFHNFDILLFPNPFRSNFHMVVQSSNLNDLVYIRVFEVSGKLVTEIEKVNPNEDVTLGENLLKGMYMVEVLQGDAKKVIRVIKSE